jgi:hypothetical protein
MASAEAGTAGATVESSAAAATETATTGAESAAGGADHEPGGAHPVPELSGYLADQPFAGVAVVQGADQTVSQSVPCQV